MTNSIKTVVETYLNDCKQTVINAYFERELRNSYDTEQYAACETSLELLDSLGVTATEVDQFGGEGEGDLYWTVYKYTKGDEVAFAKFEGSYNSYGGAEYDCWTFVVPKEVLVTQYFTDV